MFLKERQDAIVALLASQGRVRVSDLAQRFEVSEDCIRKDLQQLDAAGRCRRVYGGAMPVEPQVELDARRRVGTDLAEKRLVAQRAFPLIHDDQTVFLDIATTNLELARLIGESDLRCTVVSNMFDVLMAVAANPRATAVCPGGTVVASLSGLVGATTLADLQRTRFDLAFVGALGASLEDDAVYTFDADDGAIKRCAIERSDKSYLVTASRKFDYQGGFQYARLTDLTGLATDDDRPAVREGAAGLGLEVM